MSQNGNKRTIGYGCLGPITISKDSKMSKSFKTEEGRLGSMLTHNPPFLSLCLNGTKKLP